MSFRTDKIRGKHPITPKKGIKETDLNIKEKGSNDTITVSIKNKPDITLGKGIISTTSFNQLPAETKYKTIGIGSMYDFLRAVGRGKGNGELADKDLYNNAHMFRGYDWNQFNDKQKGLIAKALDGIWTSEVTHSNGVRRVEFKHIFEPYPKGDYVLAKYLSPDDAGLGVRPSSHEVTTYPELLPKVTKFISQENNKNNLNKYAEQLREEGDLNSAVYTFRKIHPKASYKEIAGWLGYGATVDDIKRVLGE